jgi:peptidoglycan/xylan/chitin deacetylase (PgdA/CDA1 family)
VRGFQIGIVVAPLLCSLTACGVVGVQADGPPAPTTTVTVTAAPTADADNAREGYADEFVDPSDATPSQGAIAPTPTGQAPANVDVDWDSGKGTPENPALDPSPTGWYEAAFGGPPDSQGRVLYVTFDDGPAPATPQVLSLLAQYDAAATFFVVGSSAAAQPDMVARVQQAGHAVGNHTYSHSDLTTLSPGEVASELTSTSAVAPQIGNCMRPPYGAIDAASGEVAEQLGLQPIMWTGQAFDWRPPPVPEIVSEIKAVSKPGAVILLHDGSSNRDNTVAALAELLPYWQQEGYQLKAIPACF